MLGQVGFYVGRFGGGEVRVGLYVVFVLGFMFGFI